jgi:trehalose 6-phosphate synthase
MRTTWISPIGSQLLRAGAHGVDRDGFTLSRHEWLRPVRIDEASFARASEFATRLLWFAHHNLFGCYPLARCAWEPDNHRAFVQLNDRMAQAISERSIANCGLVLVNDYQLSLVPALVREYGDRRRLVHMSYTAFADLNSWRKLPARFRVQILQGLLGADLVGFTATRWARRFVDAVVFDGCGEWDANDSTVRHGHTQTAIRVYPVHVGVDELVRELEKDASEAWEATLRPAGCESLIARADRMDPAKNAIVGFQAFGVLLDRRPRLRTRVHFAACLSPSRGDIDEYGNYSRAVTEIVRQTNERYPGSVRLYLDEDRVRTLTLLRMADVTLVNSRADGMNFVAQEAAVLGTRNGSLVLSRNTGSTDLLEDVAILLEDPEDVSETARALETALSLSPQIRRTRAATLAARVRGPHPPLVSRLLQTLNAT